jgi:hypothetical protein
MDKPTCDNDGFSKLALQTNARHAILKNTDQCIKLIKEKSLEASNFGQREAEVNCTKHDKTLVRAFLKTSGLKVALNYEDGGYIIEW